MIHTVLAARSDFSTGVSILPVDKLVEQAVAADAKAVAVADIMSVSGLIDLTSKAKKAGLKPILGCQLRLVDDDRITWRKSKEDKKAPPEYFVTYYVLSEAGLKGLYRLLSLANDEAHFYNVPRLAFADLFAALDTLTGDDAAIASGDVHSLVRHAQASHYLQRVKGALGASKTFLALSPIDTPYWDAINARAIALAIELDLPTLVTRPVYYPKGYADANDIMGAVCSNALITDPWFNSPHQRDMHVMDQRELVDEVKAAIKRLTVRGVPTPGVHFMRGLQNTKELVDLVAYEWAKAPPSLPVMSPNEFRSTVDLCMAGWKERFSQEVFGHKPTPDELRDIYQPRLKYELSVLKKLEFSGYFLLVHDVVSFAKRSGIRVGPGRGSVGGSLVAYLMGITDCDPIRFGLMFERFINPDRIDLPDADLDFMSERRHEVVEYLVGKYGRERVAGVSNFLELRAASALRSVSKAFGMEEADYRCSKLVPAEHGVPVKLSDAAKQVPEIEAFRVANSDVWETCVRLENVNRTLGMHAAGVIVAGCDLVELAVVERRKAEPVVNWDKRQVEDQGLIKMDILGLQTLDLIDLAVKYVRERHSAKADILRIPLDDAKVLDAFAQGQTMGVFQFESGGMRRLLRELGKDGFITFEDITAATALYRPGPMESGMMDSFWKRKQGEEDVEYDHALMEPALQETYGVMVYQEQVMKVSQVIAGYNGAEADTLRKIMGKKEPAKMALERDKFVAGCVATVSMDEAEAGELFDKIEGFAGYGFNKSHSVEYTLISYQSMWLKVNYPVEFFAAALSILGEDKLAGVLKEAKRLGIEVELPDVNHSTGRFEILTDTRLSVPFGKVKGLTEKTAAAIVEARGTVPFKSRADFETRARGRFCNIGHITKLDQIGAFASVEPGTPSRENPSRILAQRDLIPGLVTAYVPVHHELRRDDDTKEDWANLVNDYRTENKADGLAVSAMMGKTSKFMVITDAPTAGEERLAMMGPGRGSAVDEALNEAGLVIGDGYWTALIKRPKVGKQVSLDEIKRYAPYLMREINLLKPPAIVLLGSGTVRHFFPDFKGKASEAAGKVVYNAELDANIVIGFNPGEVFHDESKQELLNEVFRVAALLTE